MAWQWVLPLAKDLGVLAIRTSTHPIDSRSRRNARDAIENSRHRLGGAAGASVRAIGAVDAGGPAAGPEIPILARGDSAGSATRPIASR